MASGGLKKLGPARPLVAVALALLLAAGFAACGGTAGKTTTAKPMVVIGARESAEEEVLAEIYAQALRHAGFDVPKVVRLFDEPESAPLALRRGRIDAYTDHLSTATSLAWVDESEWVPASTDEAYGEAQDRLEQEEMAPLPPAPFSSTNLLIALKKTARENGWRTISDLSKHTGPVIPIAGIQGCHESINCMEGLERLYGLTSIGLISGLATYDEVFKNLDDGSAELALVPSTDARLYTERSRFAVLEEDKHLFPAGNGIVVTTPQLLDEAGPDLEATIVGAQKNLTTDVMQELDAKVEAEGESPAAVAAQYLRP